MVFGWGSKQYQPLSDDGAQKTGGRKIDSPPRHATLSQSDDDDRDTDERGGEARIFHAQTTLPQELSFVVPEDHRRGDPVCVSGPHGPLLLPVPESARSGDHLTVRLGPTASYRVPVPPGKGPGDPVSFDGDGGEQLQVSVPEGMKPGDIFEVTQPSLMVQVPLKAVEGDQLVFSAPDGRELSALVPPGLQPGQYFAVSLQ
jgi:hypothetical protein